MDRIKTTDKSVMRLIKAAVPDYRGRRVSVSTYIPKRLDSYWDEGSRDYWYFVDMTTLRSVEVQSNHPYFEKDRPRDLESLPSGIALVCHSYRGNFKYMTVHVNACDLAPLLPEKA
jgi:hypothetical protein